MDRQQRARLAFNGLAIFVLGLVIAIPFAMVFTSRDDQHTHLWSVAHLEALVHGLLLMGLGANGKLIVLPRAHETVFDAHRGRRDRGAEPAALRSRAHSRS